MTHKMEDIELLCKHFAENLDIELDFQEDIPPATDGHKVYLPSNMNKSIILELLGALIHETGHIKHTNMGYFQNICNDNPILGNIVNVLEDIRIDNKVCMKYPKANELLKMLYTYAMDKNKEKLKEEELPYKILKHLILQAKGFKDLYYDEEALKIINELVLEKYSIAAKQAYDIYGIEKLANNLLTELTSYFKQQPQAGVPKAKLENIIKEQQGKIQQNTKEIEKLKDERCNTGKDLRELYDNKNKRLTSEKRMETNIRKKENSIYMENNKEIIEKTKKSLEKNKDNLQKHKQETDLLCKELSKKEITYEEMGKDLNKKVNENEKMKRLIEGLQQENSIEQLFGVEEVCSIGFNSIEKDDIINKSDIPELNLNKNLDEKIRDYFIRKYEERINTDETGRISRNKIHKILTFENDIYQENKTYEKPTYIGFLLDSSGSMSGRHSNRAAGLITASEALLKSLKRVIEEDNLDVHIGVYQFSYHMESIINFEEPLDITKIQEKYKTGGSTEILSSVNKLTRIIQDKGLDSDKIIMVLSDADISSYDAKTLRNQILPDVKIVYIGIQANLRNDNTKALFQYNIENMEDTLEILTDIITSN